MSKPIQVKNGAFEREVLQASLPVLVDFYADWCLPCQATAPVIEEIAAAFEERLKVVKVDIDENKELSQEYKVQGIPTLILFRGGQAIERIIGFLPKAQLIKVVEKHL